jgi:DNA-binding transcriptional ArsR family regulator
VTALAAATGRSVTAISHALQILRINGAVTATREGRLVRYAITDDAVSDLLTGVDAGLRT